MRRISFGFCALVAIAGVVVACHDASVDPSVLAPAKWSVWLAVPKPIAEAGCSIGATPDSTRSRVAVVQAKDLPFEIPPLTRIEGRSGRRASFRVQRFHIQAADGRPGLLVACFAPLVGSRAGIVESIQGVSERQWLQVAREVAGAPAFDQPLERAVGTALRGATFPKATHVHHASDPAMNKSLGDTLPQPAFSCPSCGPPQQLAGITVTAD